MNDEIATKLLEIKPMLSSKFHVEKIGVFGSFARDEESQIAAIEYYAK